MIKDGKLICKEVRIENSSRCNASCIMCPREKMTRVQMDMPLDHFISLVDQAKELGAETISVFGYGEPLMDKTIAQKIQYCTNKGLKTFITTNGSRLDTEIAHSLLWAGLSDIRFSVHGLYHKNYEKIHRGLDWNNFILNLNNFNAINKDFDCTTHITCMPLSGESIEDLKRYWEPLADHLEIWKPHNWAGARSYRKTLLQRKTCHRPFSGPVQINADGTIMVCCFDTDAEMTIGDTYVQSIKDILQNSIDLKRIQKNHKSGKHGFTPCATCDQLNDGDNPLLYSNRDHSMAIYRTSTTKYALGGKDNGSLHKKTTAK